MHFKRAPQRYGQTPPPETPYQRAGQIWDDRIGSARVQAYNWRRVAFGSQALALVLAGGMIWQSSQSRIEPYVVAVDRLGEVQAFGPAQQNYQPTDLELAAQLRRFIIDVRSVSTDPVVVRERWYEAYDLASKNGDVFLDGYAQANDPFARIGEHSVMVQITSVVRASPTSFQVKWEEKAFEHGALGKTERWTAILTLVRQKPKIKAELKRNPSGFYVDAVDWTQEADAPAPAGPPPAPPAAPSPYAEPAPPPTSTSGAIQP